MRRDKAVTRILLILSVVHAAASAPATIRQRSLEVTKDMTPALEKRGYWDWQETSHAPPQVDNNLSTTSGTVLSRDNTPLAPGDPELHSDPSPELGTPHLNIDRPPTSGTPELQNHPPPAPGSFGDYVDRYLKWHSSGSVGPEPTASGRPPGSFEDYFNRYKSWHDSGSVGPEPTPFRPGYEAAPSSHAPQPLEPEAPKTHTVFNNALKQKLAVGGQVAAVVGASAVFTYGVVKLIEDHSHNKSQPAGRDLASGGVVIRGESMHPLPPKRPVSRAKDKLRSEDLRLLSILMRRALERLD